MFNSCRLSSTKGSVTQGVPSLLEAFFLDALLLEALFASDSLRDALRLGFLFRRSSLFLFDTVTVSLFLSS